MNPVMMGLVIILGIALLVFWIMEIVTAFKKGDGPLMGILSIVLCSLGGFIIGWIFSKKWGITKLMAMWSIVYVLFIVIYVTQVASAVSQIQEMQPAP